jgi:hypothetical protein
LPEDSATLDATGLVSDPSRTFALTEAGKLALGLANNAKQTTMTLSNSALNRKPTITRIVRLNTSGMSSGMKTQTLKLAPAGSTTTTMSSSNAPKIIKVTPEQFAALKAGKQILTFLLKK